MGGHLYRGDPLPSLLDRLHGGLLGTASPPREPLGPSRACAPCRRVPCVRKAPGGEDAPCSPHAGGDWAREGASSSRAVPEPPALPLEQVTARGLSACAMERGANAMQPHGRAQRQGGRKSDGRPPRAPVEEARFRSSASPVTEKGRRAKSYAASTTVCHDATSGLHSPAPISRCGVAASEGGHPMRPVPCRAPLRRPFGRPALPVDRGPWRAPSH